MMENHKGRKAAEEALKQSEERYRRLVDNSPDIVYSFSDKRGGIYYSDCTGKILGYPREHLYNHPFLWNESIHPDDRGMIVQAIQAFAQGKHFDVEYRVRDSKGEWLWFRDRSIGRRVEGSEIIIDGIATDITARKVADAALKRSADEIEDLYNNAPCGYHSLDADGLIIQMNDTELNWIGYTREEVVGKMKLAELFTPRTLHGFKDSFPRFKESGDQREFEIEIVRKDGTILPALVSATAVRDRDGNFVKSRSTVYDITERKKVEEVQRRMIEIIEATSDFVATADTMGNVLYFNKAARKMLGIGQDEDISHIHVADTHPAWAAKLVLEVGIPTATREGTWWGETAFLHRDGHEIATSQVIISHKDKEGNVRFFSTIVRDITEIKKARELREELQQRHEELINRLNVGVYRVTANGRFFEANPALLNIYEARSKEELFMHHVKDFIEDANTFDALSEKLAKDGFLKNAEIAISTLRGNKFLASISGFLRKDKEGNTYFDGLMEDVTERRKLEEQLMQAQKMEAVGQLTGGIAHDFNNLLSSILGNCSLLALKAENGPALDENVENIKKAVHRGANLTKALLTFSRNRPIQLAPVNLEAVLADTRRLLPGVIREDIELRIGVPDTEMVVMADGVQIEQVLLNLLTNAQDAMPNGGVVDIGMRRIELGPDFIGRDGFGGSEPYALITVADSGTGMDADTQKRIFEPFFTTKGSGKGTGLGLAMVYGIVKQHRGFINVESAPGKGTKFAVYLPLTDSPVEKKGTAAPTPPRGSMETVLFAEDDADVRKATTAVLEYAGYHVIEAENGEEAVELFRKNHDSIHLCILDMIMPKMNGKEAFDEMKKVRPRNKALFMSGYTADIIASADFAGEDFHFLAKPVAPEEFLGKIREMLGNSGG